ncbi:hypothetical protein CWO89_35460 [Bradyrhizobium sp. Leo170]|nr:hypothetical protein CWO89_35460 [Bradyrhizobium sp. Leo170]
MAAARAFSSEVDTGSREENASKQESRASVLIQSEPKMLWSMIRKSGDLFSEKDHAQTKS